VNITPPLPADPSTNAGYNLSLNTRLSSRCFDSPTRWATPKNLPWGNCRPCGC